MPRPAKQQVIHCEPEGSYPSGRLSWVKTLQLALICALTAALSLVRIHGYYSVAGTTSSQLSPGSFFSNISSGNKVCPGVSGNSISHAGYIGLKGDSDATPKRSFFWYFEADEDPDNAPVILTIGGGPGTSGMMNPVFGQSACVISSSGLVGNPNRWTERFNLVALDHPVGVGFSYGTRVNNSRSAAHDVYDFLQKFFVLYPQLSKNKFIVSGGSYGGIYVPNIATVIHEQNVALRAGNGQPGAVHINLDALIVSNPLSDPMAHFTWVLHYRCALHQVFNATVCLEAYEGLPNCVEKLEVAFEEATLQNRLAARHACWKIENFEAVNGTVIEDIRLQCHEQDPLRCHPEFGWMEDLFQNATTKDALSVPVHVNFTALNVVVTEEFSSTGDIFYQHHHLYEPLLSHGIRLLHYIGSQDANCAWPGIFSFLKRLRTPFRDAFQTTPDVPWPSEEGRVGTVRAVGEGAGNLTYILLDGAGHFTVKDQPAVAKTIVEHWVENRPWFD